MRFHAIQDGTGIIGYDAGRGLFEAYGPSALSASGPPINGVSGFAPGCTWQDLANGHDYVNLGSKTSLHLGLQ